MSSMLKLNKIFRFLFKLLRKDRVKKGKENLTNRFKLKKYEYTNLKKNVFFQENPLSFYIFWFKFVVFIFLFFVREAAKKFFFNPSSLGFFGFFF